MNCLLTKLSTGRMDFSSFIPSQTDNHLTLLEESKRFWTRWTNQSLWWGIKQIWFTYGRSARTKVSYRFDQMNILMEVILIGDILAKDFECSWSEVAAAEQVVQVAEAFHDLCHKVKQRKRNKQSLLDRMLGGKAGTMRTYSRGKSDSALPKD